MSFDPYDKVFKMYNNLQHSRTSAFFAKVQNKSSLCVLYAVWVPHFAVVIDLKHDVLNDIQTLISGIFELIQNKKRTLLVLLLLQVKDRISSFFFFCTLLR